MKKITCNVGNDTLTGSIFHPQKSVSIYPAVLFVHGWESNETGYIPRAEAVSNCGAVCMTFNLRGHGSSGDDLSTVSRKDHLTDVIAAYDYLISQPDVDRSRIGVVRASYGGYLSSIMTSARPVQWLALRAPDLYKDDNFDVATASLIRKNILVYRQSDIKPEQNFALEALTHFNNSVLLIQSENDTIVPPQTIHNYQEALKHNHKVKHVILPDADHTLSTAEYKTAFISTLTQAFTEWLR